MCKAYLPIKNMKYKFKADERSKRFMFWDTWYKAHFLDSSSAPKLGPTAANTN